MIKIMRKKSYKGLSALVMVGLVESEYRKVSDDTIHTAWRSDWRSIDRVSDCTTFVQSLGTDILAAGQ